MGAKCRLQVVFGLLFNGNHVITTLQISFVVRCGEMDIEFGVKMNRKMTARKNGENEKIDKGK